MKISIVVPIVSLEEIKFLRTKLLEFQGVELIYVSSTKENESLSLKEQVIYLDTNSRGERLHAGAKVATGDIILFHHPRSVLDFNAINELMLIKEKTFWGGFTHKFDTSSFWLKFTSAYSNLYRADFLNILYLDHCLFVTKDLLEKINGFPKASIFEDTLFSYKLRKIKKSIRLKSISETSAIRFNKNGFWRQSYLNFKMKYQFYKNYNLDEMNDEYEKGLDLNKKKDPVA